MINIRKIIAGFVISSTALLFAPTLDAILPQEETSSSVVATIGEWIKNHPYLAIGTSATIITSAFIAHSMRKLYQTNAAFKQSEWFELIFQGDINRIDFQLEQQKADVNTITDSGETALMIATKMGNTDLIKTLLKHGANITIQNHNGETALMCAAIYTQPEAMAILLDDQYVDAPALRTIIHQQDNLKRTALVLAIKRLYQNRLDNNTSNRMHDYINGALEHIRNKKASSHYLLIKASTQLFAIMTNELLSS